MKKREYTSRPQRVLVIEFQPEHLDEINEFIQKKLVIPAYCIIGPFPSLIGKKWKYEMELNGQWEYTIYPGDYLAVYFVPYAPNEFQRFEVLTAYENPTKSKEIG